MAAALKRAGFSVVLKKNVQQQEMEEAVENFGNRLKRGGVGLFYYAGHGLQINGINYLIPIGAKINKESDVKYQSIDINKVLDEMANASNVLNIVILDACRDNPYSRSFRSASRGLAIVSNAPAGTFISYSTGAGQVARDGEGRNSPYAKALLENIVKPGLTINKVFMNVRSKVKRETGQVPWELSSLEGDFFFILSKGTVQTTRNEPSVYAPEIEQGRELIRNGDLKNLNDWIIQQSMSPSNGRHEVFPENDGIKFKNTEGNTRMGIMQILDVDVTNARNLILNAVVKADVQTLTGTGWQGREAPIEVTVTYTDVQGIKRVGLGSMANPPESQADRMFWHGFYYAPPEGYSQTWHGTKVDQGQWYTFQFDLMTLRPQPKIIHAVGAGGSGWPVREGKVSSISLKVF
jgi:hypothetical protein